MYSRHDPHEYYVWRLKTKRSINQVWARVDGLVKSPFSLFKDNNEGGKRWRQ